jgi:hypothetical protein
MWIVRSTSSVADDEFSAHLMFKQLLTRAEAARDLARDLVAESRALLPASKDTRRSRAPVRCAWCNSYEIAGEWRQEADVPSYFLARRKPDVVSHGICPSCIEELRSSGRSR